jgi:hypothetical protein
MVVKINAQADTTAVITTAESLTATTWKWNSKIYLLVEHNQ